MQDAVLALEAGIVAGKTVEMRNDGTGGVEIFGCTCGGLSFETAETENTELIHSDAIHEQPLHLGDGTIVTAEHLAETEVRFTAAGIETGQEERVTRGERVLESIQTGLRFSGESFGAGLPTPIPGPFPTVWRKGVQG